MCLACRTWESPKTESSLGSVAAPRTSPLALPRYFLVDSWHGLVTSIMTYCSPSLGSPFQERIEVDLRKRKMSIMDSDAGPLPPSSPRPYKNARVAQRSQQPPKPVLDMSVYFLALWANLLTFIMTSTWDSPKTEGSSRSLANASPSVSVHSG